MYIHQLCHYHYSIIITEHENNGQTSDVFRALLGTNPDKCPSQTTLQFSDHFWYNVLNFICANICPDTFQSLFHALYSGTAKHFVVWHILLLLIKTDQ